ncbi:MAG: PH domain-containing protein [Gemmatimonadales bacterium]|nr:MAG: PH domain-containing protein [Gemmatimonadales bacterium]
MRIRRASNRCSDMGTPSAPGTPSEMARVRIEGVEEALPLGESLLWEGRPDLKTLAFRVLYLRVLLGYWALVAVGFLLAGALGGRTTGNLAADLVWLLVVAAVGSAIIFGFAAAVRGSTTYALTDRRVVIRLGVAFPSVLNLPLHRIGSVDVRRTGRDAEGRDVGDVVLTPVGDDRVGWLYLWPHVKPWAWRDPIPAFRAVPDVASAGEAVARQVRRRLEEVARDEEVAS